MQKYEKKVRYGIIDLSKCNNSDYKGLRLAEITKKILYLKYYSYLCNENEMRGQQRSPSLLLMIDKIKVLELVQDALNGSDKFLVNLKITNDNRIFIDIDGDNGILIDDCIELSRSIENQLDRDVEDFELNVSSAGADSPLKMPRQYRKNIGRTLLVETFDGEKIEGRLTDADDQQCIVKVRGTKSENGVNHTFAYSDIKQAKVVIKF